MTSPGIKLIKKVSIADSINDEKNEEQVIQIVSNEPVQIFSPVPIVGLSDAEKAKEKSSSNDLENQLSLPVVQLEIGNPDLNPTSSSNALALSENKGKNNQVEENVFMIPPLLRVRQFAVQERLPISIDEIRRRIGPPESLSQALILSLLRLNRERAKHLRKALTQFGITELPNRSAVISSFSRLSEAESRGLAEDYYYLSARFMKVKEIHQALVPQNGGEISFTPKARGARLVLEQIMAEIEKRDTDLNLLTHGFSPLVLRAVFNVLIEILTFKEKERELVFDAPNKIEL